MYPEKIDGHTDRKCSALYHPGVGIVTDTIFYHANFPNYPVEMYFEKLGINNQKVINQMLTDGWKIVNIRLELIV